MAGRWAVAAAGVYGKYPIDPEAAALDTGRLDAGKFVAALVAAGKLEEAVTFTANALMIREALWWACECVEAGLATDACRKYVTEPTDPNRRAAMAAAEAADFGTAGATAALAAFLSAGSLSGPGLPTVPPPDGLAAKTVAGAVMLASAMNGPPAEAGDRLRKYLAIGTEVGDGKRRWPPRAEKAK